MTENTPDKRGRTSYNNMPVNLTELIKGKTVQALVEKFTRELHKTAELVGENENALLAIQQGVHALVQKLLEKPETEALARAIQKLLLRAHEGAGNPPSQRRQERRKERSPFDEWIETVNFRTKTINLIENYLAQKTGKAKSELTPQDFADAFSDENGHFDASELLNQKGIGEATRRDFFDDLTYTSNGNVVPPLIMRSEGVYVWNPDCLAKIFI